MFGLPEFTLAHVTGETVHFNPKFCALFCHFLNDLAYCIDCVGKDTTGNQSDNDNIDFFNCSNWIDISVAKSYHSYNCPIS